jgi:hypothetical protein
MDLPLRGPRTLLRSLLVAVAIVAVVAPAGGQAPAQAPAKAPTAPGVASLGWLTGCWEQRSGNLVIEEHWLAPRGGVLLGMSRTTRGDALVGYEFLRIHARGDSLLLVAEPAGQSRTEFRARAVSGREVVFENPAHDFPQRIHYRAVRTDSLRARVEGTRGGQLRGFDVAYERTACPAASSAR